MIYIGGRPNRDWEAEIQECDGSLFIRVEDRKDPEFWVEIILSDEDLRPAAVASIRTQIAGMLGIDPARVTVPDDAERLVAVVRPANNDPIDYRPSAN